MKDVAQFFKVLADEARLKVLWLLFNNAELCVCDIMETLEITQSKASRHLATLRHAGLVTDRKVGAWSYYSLCSVEDEVGRAQLEALRASLAAHEGAGEVLRDLQRWLKRKKSGACVGDGARDRTTGRASKKAPAQGGRRAVRTRHGSSIEASAPGAR